MPHQLWLRRLMEDSALHNHMICRLTHGFTGSDIRQCFQVLTCFLHTQGRTTECLLHKTPRI
jgi:hypothetical protein